MSPRTHMQVELEPWSELQLRLKMENFIKNMFHRCGFVDHLDCGCKKDCNKHLATHQIFQLPQRVKQLLMFESLVISMDYLDYLMRQTPDFCENLECVLLSDELSAKRRPHNSRVARNWLSVSGRATTVLRWMLRKNDKLELPCCQ